MRGVAIRPKLFILLLLIAAGAAAYYFLFYRPAHRPAIEVVYVLPDSVDLVNAPVRVRITVATAKSGDRVEVLERSGDWARVRLANGVEGWVEASQLLDAQTYSRAVQLLGQLEKDLPQSVGHTATVANVRLEPSRDAPQVAQFLANQSVEVFGRQVVDQPAAPGELPPSAPVRDVWYLVRSGKQAGWLLGRFVDLDIPAAISMYAHSVNMVAWLVLNTVDDDGRQVPQYLAADRSGTQEVDFTRIRVFTWWAKRQQYATAYVESNLNGFFPIRVMQRDSLPHFRLRLMDRKGRQFQKVYAMYGTIVRPLGIVEGWESDAIPERGVTKPRGAR